MKKPQYFFALTLLLLLAFNPKINAQCPGNIQEQGNNNAQTVTLTFNNSSGTALASCTCNVAGVSGNLSCPNTCPYDVPGSGYSTILFSMPPDNCLYTSGGILITVLPIQLVRFTAEVNNRQVELKWITASEVNNDYFTIEKTNDGGIYEIVTRVQSNGNSTSTVNYSAVDKSPTIGTAYYRLKQTDFDGRFSYSNLVAVTYNDDGTFSFDVYPNPNNGSNVNLNINSKGNKEIVVVVYDVMGKEYYSKVLVTGGIGSNLFAIDPSQKLSSGIYYVTATSDERVYSKRLIVR